jgi:hypothetical protein
MSVLLEQYCLLALLNSLFNLRSIASIVEIVIPEKLDRVCFSGDMTGSFLYI